MRIAYVLEVNPYVNSGIIKKVNDQVQYWESKNNQVLLLIVWPKPNNTKSSSSYIKGDTLSSNFANKLNKGFVKNYVNKILCAKKLSKKLKDYSPDILYIRQNIWYPGISGILKKYNTILEINSVDTIEINYSSVLKKKVYLYGREKIINSVKGLVAVSPDILKHYEKFDIPSVVVSNGIKLSKIKKIKKNLADEKANLVFVGSSNMQWHGLDKIMELAEILNSCFFHIVGYDRDSFSNTPQNVKFYGWVEKDQLEKIYEKSHFGIGSFNNYLVGKKVDSTLKVREYLAYGLPVIIGHEDVDFYDSDFVLKVTNSEGNFLNEEKILNYIDKNRNTVIDNEFLKKIDSSTKEEERLTFFNIIYHN